jgi:cell division protein FtsB
MIANTAGTQTNTAVIILNAIANSSLGLKIESLAIKYGVLNATMAAGTRTLKVALGVIGLVTVAIGLAAAAFDYFHISQKEAFEAIKKANENYSSQKEKLDELNNTLETTKERIEELSKQDSLTIIE